MMRLWTSLAALMSTKTNPLDIIYLLQVYNYNIHTKGIKWGDILLRRSKHSQVYITYINEKISKEKEYEYLSSLRHPNIIVPTEVSKQYIIMPFYDKDLDKDSGDIPYQDLI